MNYLEKDERPWGRYFVLQDESNYKVKILSERDMYLKIFDTFSDIKIEKAKKKNKVDI